MNLDNSSSLENYAEVWKKLKRQTDLCLGGLTEEQINNCVGDRRESVAILIKHVSEHLTSRFSNFWTTDGEKDRNKSMELSQDFISKRELLNLWNSSWEIVMKTLEELNWTDLNKYKKIRNEDTTVFLYLTNVLSHTSFHIGQIITIHSILTT